MSDATQTVQSERASQESEEIAPEELSGGDSLRDRLVRELAAGEIGFHRLPDDLSAAEQAEVRREALERLTGASLENVGRFLVDPERAGKGNCENFIGATQIPLGIVGPLHIRGDETQGPVYVPLATTEAALVASTNRGCSALAEVGGVRVRVEDVGMTRAPVFATSGIDESERFLAWVRENEDRIREAAEETSKYLELVEIRPHRVGSTVLLRFRFRTGDAMGMNMVTIAVAKVVREVIEPESGVRCVALSGNYCVDKKAAAVNFQEGRGKRIFAEAVVPAEVLERKLKVRARDLVEVQYRKNLLGSISAGAQGFNAHFANIVAAYFVATGQDLAHVVEGSLGITCVEPRDDGDVYVSVYLPDAPVGAVGGGMNLACQKEALAILGVELDPSRPGAAARRVAEILGGVVLAGELSLMAALTSHDLAGAHERLRSAWIPEG